MVDADEWKDRLVLNRTYHITARFIDDDAIFVGIGVEGIPDQPVFSFFGGVTRMLPWEGIGRIDPVDDG